MVNSNRKGKAGEREFAEFLRSLGVEARRGVQYQGSPESPDVVTSLENVHFEVKRTEKLRIWEAMDQALTECGGALPVVAFRCSRKPWLAVLPMERLVAMLKARK